MNFRALLLISTLSVLASTAHANEAAPKQSADIALDNCLETAVSTPDIEGCYQEAMTSWDNALNVQYKALLAGQSDAFKSAMRQSQRDWIKYKDNYFLALNARYGAMDGTIWRIVAAQSKMNVIRDKALDLQRLAKSTDLTGE